MECWTNFHAVTGEGGRKSRAAPTTVCNAYAYLIMVLAHKTVIRYLISFPVSLT